MGPAIQRGLVPGTGEYANDLIAPYLGTIALSARSRYRIAAWALGTGTVDADNKSSSFALNDGTAAGTSTVVPRRRSHDDARAGLTLRGP